MTAPAPATLRLCVRRCRIPADGGLAVQVALRVPSDVACIEEVVDLVMRHCTCASWLCRRSRFNVRVALAEALANAIVAGNQENPSKSVHLQAELGPEYVRLQVTDEGIGFDPAQLRDPILPEDLDRPNGRGLFLIRQLVDEVQFNDQGNSICMTLRRR